MEGYRLEKTVLAAACYFIREHERIVGEHPTGLLFNRYMVLLNRHLLGLGKDMRLPHCWYRWGDEVIAYAFGDYVAFNREGTYLTSTEWLGEDVPLEPRMPYSKEISSFTADFIKDRSGREGSETAVDETYDGAPYDFQRNYRMVRENLREARHSHVDPREGMLPELFKKAMDSFPREFKDVEESKDHFRILFEAALSKNADLDDLFYMSEDFWFMFCYHLRLKKNYNATEETLRIWKAAKEEGDAKFEEILQDLAHAFAADSEDRWMKEAIAARERRIRDYEALLDEFYNDDRVSG